MTATHTNTLTRTHRHIDRIILCQLSDGECELSSLVEPYIPTESAQNFFNLIKLEAISGKANKSCPKLQASSVRGRARDYATPLLGTTENSFCAGKYTCLLYWAANSLISFCKAERFIIVNQEKFVQAHFSKCIDSTPSN